MESKKNIQRISTEFEKLKLRHVFHDYTDKYLSCDFCRFKLSKEDNLYYRKSSQDIACTRCKWERNDVSADFKLLVTLFIHEQSIEKVYQNKVKVSLLVSNPKFNSLECKMGFEKYKNYDVIVERHGTGVFPPSPVKTPEWIKYIDTLQGLIEEGTQMHHCVGANFEFAYSGQEFYYKVLVPVRATLSLRISGDAVVIKELALLGNAKPSYETLRRVREWVNAVGLAIKT